MKYYLLALMAFLLLPCSEVIGNDVCPVEIGEPIPYIESFETGFGSWSIISGGSIWTRQSGSTPSTGTGPTSASDGSYYLFTEASGGGTNQVAIIEGPSFSLTSQVSYDFSFDHHMYGFGTGVLKLEVSTNSGSNWIPLWTLSGPQDNNWFSTTIDLSAYGGQTIQLRFHATVGPNYASDMAIDNLSLVEISSPPVLSCSQLVSSFPYTEGFEAGEGMWTETSTADIWRRLIGNTGSGQTGPSSASGGSYYMYTEASSPNYPNKQGYFEGPCFDFSQIASAQLNFNYHMYGNTMGTLHVELMSDNNPEWQVIWSRTGESGTDWLSAVIDLSAYVGQKIKLRFYGLTGTSYRSDMAIDEVTILATTPSYPVGCNDLITNFPYLESFESDWGDWSEKISTNIWRRQSGGTPSGNTGPSSAIAGAYYVHIESSNPNYPNKTAILEGPCFNLNGAYSADFTFQYSMLGTQIGQIRLEVSTDAGANWNSVWFKEGNQGNGPQSNSWYFTSVDLSDYLGEEIKLRFRAITGEGYRGDIAIDDIQFDVLNYNPSGLYQAKVVHLGTTAYDHSTLLGVGVQNVLVSIDNQDNSSDLDLITNASGTFNTAFNSGVKTINPSTQDDNWLNGVSTSDMQVIAGHAQGFSTITDPLKRLAADVNGDGEITMADVYMVQDLILGNIDAFPNGENWRFISNIFVRESSVHPDKVFVADFWNQSKEDYTGAQYPFKAGLRSAGTRLAYSGLDSWINTLPNYFIEANSNCESPADFLLLKMGDVNGNASSAGLPYPSGSSSLVATGGSTNSARNNEVGFSTNDKAAREKYIVSIYATTEEKVHSFELGLRYDRELFTLDRIVKGSSDLNQEDRRNFSDELSTSEVIKAIWYDKSGVGKRFGRISNGNGNGNNDNGNNGNSSNGKLIMKVMLDANLDDLDVLSGIQLDQTVFPAAFYGVEGQALDGVDLELVIKKTGN